MRWTYHAVFALVLGTAAVVDAGSKVNQLPATVEAALASPDRFELLSLEPGMPRGNPKDAFHGWEVLGRTAVKDPGRVVAAIRRGVSESDGTVAMCFEPRHGVRVTSAGSVVDLVICFECLQVEAFVNDKEVAGALTTGSPQKILDDLLRKAKVPLAGAAVSR